MQSIHQFDPTRYPFSPYGFSCELWQPTVMLRPDRHNEIEFNFLLSGSVTYLIGGHRLTIRAGHIALFWGAIPHQIVDWEGEEPYFVVTLPLGWFLSASMPAAFAQAILKGELIIDMVPLETDPMQFKRWEEDLRGNNEMLRRSTLLELQARLLRIAHAQPAMAKTQPLSPSLSRADQLACYIAQNYQTQLSADGIAKACGLHPNYAMNLFKQALGSTMTDFIVQHRLSHAQRLLLTTDDSVTEIAFSSGFQSLSRFNDAFKRICGCSPRGYRKYHRGRN